MISRKLSVILLAMVFIIGAVGSAHAYGSYLTAFNSTYGTSGTALNTCGVCHVDPAGGGTRNSYGKAFEAVPTHSSNPAGAFATIGSQASACSGYTYLQLINLGINPGNGSCPTPPVACTGYTYSAWSACGTNGQQTRTVTGNTPSGCTGTPPSAAVLTQACTPPPVACTGYTYSAWSACGTDGQQTRTVTGNTPSGCTGTPPTAAVLTQACTPPPPTACTGYTYSAWSACGTNGQQTRTVTGNTPSGCTGTPSTAAVLTQACNPSTVACKGYTYSAWSACGTNGQQTRIVTGNTPAGCTGTPSRKAVLSWPCSPIPTTTDGTTLYTQYCSACHGSIQRSQVRGSSASDIKAAINDVSKMSFLKFLTDDQIKAIADALVTTTPPPPPPIPSGGVHPSGWLTQHPDFVDRNGVSSCKTCHGQDLQGRTGPSCFSCHSNSDKGDASSKGNMGD